MVLLQTAYDSETILNAYNAFLNWIEQQGLVDRTHEQPEFHLYGKVLQLDESIENDTAADLGEFLDALDQEGLSEEAAYLQGVIASEFADDSAVPVTRLMFQLMLDMNQTIQEDHDSLLEHHESARNWQVLGIVLAVIATVLSILNLIIYF